MIDKTTEELFNILDQIFDLPNNAISIQLDIGMDYSPQLTVTYIPDLKNRYSITTKKFDIKAIE